MYKKLFLLFFLLFVFSLIPLRMFASVSSGLYIFNDVMNYPPYSSALNGQGSWSGSTRFVTSNNYVQVNTLTGASTISKSGTAQSKGNQTFLLKTGDPYSMTTDYSAVSLYEGASSKVQVRLYSNRLVVNDFNGGGLTTLVSGLTQNTWYQVQIEWRTIDNKFKVHFNNNATTTVWFSASSTFTNLDKIAFDFYGDCPNYTDRGYFGSISHESYFPSFEVEPVYVPADSTTTISSGQVNLTGSIFLSTSTDWEASSTQFVINVVPTDSAEGYYFVSKSYVSSFGSYIPYSSFFSLPNHTYEVSYSLQYGLPYLIDAQGQIEINYDFDYVYPNNLESLGTMTIIVDDSDVTTTTIPLIPSGGGMVFATGTPDYVQQAIIEYFNKFFFLKSVFPFSYMSYFASWVQTLNFTNVTEVPFTFNFAFASSTIIATTSITALTSQNVRIGSTTDTFSHWAYIVSNFTFFIGFLWAMWKFAHWIFESPPDPFSFGPVNPA